MQPSEISEKIKQLKPLKEEVDPEKLTQLWTLDKGGEPINLGECSAEIFEEWVKQYVHLVDRSWPAYWRLLIINQVKRVTPLYIINEE